MVAVKAWTSRVNGSVGSAFCMAVVGAFGIGADVLTFDFIQTLFFRGWCLCQEMLQVILVVYDFSCSSKHVDAEEAEFNISWCIFNRCSMCEALALALDGLFLCNSCTRKEVVWAGNRGQVLCFRRRRSLTGAFLAFASGQGLQGQLVQTKRGGSGRGNPI
ncbi:uncharacterized protein LOC131310822 [Rhododendron vialii]|uniref:uncharacterized protein LOC131310822 n=1 Tax=Rhododendron vialii TaxID=182163 RepID=UPI00265EDB61|nr:uncharacterized protein LOC131310822 [Rhododendron vialii]